MINTQSDREWADAGQFSHLMAPLPSCRPLAMLDIGCGDCLEGEALLEAGVRLIGIDQDEVAIWEARCRLPAATFVCGDAADPPPGWRGRFDVLPIRRPDLAAQPGRWQRVFKTFPVYLSEPGTVIVTTISATEAELAKRWLGESHKLITTIEELPIMNETRILVGNKGEETVPA